jgi:hypothetical protein
VRIALVAATAWVFAVGVFIVLGCSVRGGWLPGAGAGANVGRSTRHNRYYRNDGSDDARMNYPQRTIFFLYLVSACVKVWIFDLW